MKRFVPILIFISLILSGCAAENMTSLASGCKLSDIGINVSIPRGFKGIQTECPKVAYIKKLTSQHALGFYIINSPYHYNSSDTQTPSNAVNTHVLVVQSTFDNQYRGQNYHTQRIDDSADYPPALLENGGACAGLLARLPISYLERKGVEWRRGIMCLFEQPPKGSDKWSMLQAFYFDQNLERTDYEPSGDFEKNARSLFRTIRIIEKEPKDPTKEDVVFKPIKSGPIDNSPSKESTLGVLYVKYDNLYIYSEPGFNGSKILKISKNDPLTAMTEKDKWVEVQCPTGEKGWIAKSWIDTK